jgi:HEPN domain-containing protein
MTQEGYESLAKSERLLKEAEQDWRQAHPAAVAALRALLLEWGVTPRGQTVVELLEQAAETDDTLLDFRAEATVLDRFEEQPDAAERAKIFVDAARGRLTNI